MRTVHTVTISVFCKEYEDEQAVRDGLLFLLGMDDVLRGKEKFVIGRKTAQGFEDKKITVLTATLDKERYTNRFISHLHKLLSLSQKRIILTEAKSRLDNDLFFYLRFDKRTLMTERKLLLTDRGDCYHVKMSIAAFPKQVDVALGVVGSIFSAQEKRRVGINLRKKRTELCSTT